MKTAVATTILAIAFLSAGAFAGNNDGASILRALPHTANLTVIKKNGDWPLPYRGQLEGCQINRCIEI